jgi:hypothetical protein
MAILVKHLFGLQQSADSSVGNDGTDGERNGKLLNAYQKCSFA